MWDGLTWTDQVRLVQPDPILAAAPVGVPVAPPSISRTTQPTDAPARRAAYGSPVDFRGRPLARPEETRVPVANPRGPTGGVTADGVPLASWGERFAATLVDWVVNVLLVAIVLTVAVKDFWARYSAESTAWADAVLAGQADLLSLSPELIHLGTVMTTTAAGVSLLYGVVLLGLWGATLGQRLLRLRVVPYGRGSAKLGWLQAVVRTAVWTILAQGGSFLLIVQLVNVLMPLWHPHKQTIHDLLARTQVVKPTTQSLA